jgi:hypothetical protein
VGSELDLVAVRVQRSTAKLHGWLAGLDGRKHAYIYLLMLITNAFACVCLNLQLTTTATNGGAERRCTKPHAIWASMKTAHSPAFSSLPC